MITTLTGENDGARSAELTKLVSGFVAEHGDMALERLDGEEATYERMAEAAASLPFLAPHKLVVLRRPGANKEFAEKFEAFVEGIAETNDILIVEPKLDKRLSYYKLLKKLTEFREFAVLDANGLVRFAVDYTKQQGGSISTSDAHLLIDRVGANQLIVQHELDKLLLHDPKITRKSIEELTERTPQSSVFDLLEAAFSGDSKHMQTLYDEQRALQVEPQQILAMLAWQLNVLAIVKTAGQRSPDEVAREAKLSPFVVRKTVALARRIEYARLKQLITSLREIDVRLKSEAMSADEAMQYFLLSVSVAPARS